MNTALLIAGSIIGFIGAMFTALFRNQGHLVDNWMGYPSFKNRYIAYFRNIARHNVYNSIRMYQIATDGRDIDEAFLLKLKSKDDILLRINNDEEKLQYVPVNILYRIEHISLLLRNIDLEANIFRDKIDKMTAEKTAQWSTDMFRRSIAVALIADHIAENLTATSRVPLFTAIPRFWRADTGFMVYTDKNDTNLDASFSELDLLNVDIVRKLYTRYAQDRHIDAIISNENVKNLIGP